MRLVPRNFIPLINNNVDRWELEEYLCIPHLWQEKCNLHANFNKNLFYFVMETRFDLYSTKYLVIYLGAVTKSVLIKSGYDGEFRWFIDRSSTSAKRCGNKNYLQRRISTWYECVWGGAVSQSVSSLTLYIDHSWTANVASDCFVVTFADGNLRQIQTPATAPPNSQAIKWNCNTESLVCTCMHHYSARIPDKENIEKQTGHRSTKANTLCGWILWL